MQAVTDIEDLEIVQRQLVDDFPKSLFMWNWLKINIDRPGGYGTSEVNVCYVDRFPDATITVGIDFIEAHGVNNCPELVLYAKSCVSNESLQEFLVEMNKLVDLDSIGTIAAQVINVDRRVAFDNVYGKQLAMPCHPYVCTAYWVDDAVGRRLRQTPVKVADGLTLDRLGLEDAELVNSTWPNRFIGSLPLIERRIRDFPSVCLRSADGELAAFELVHNELGSVNHLFTMPEFRRRGLAKTVELQLISEMLHQGWHPVKVVLTNNVDGLKMTERSPWWSQYGEVLWLMYGTNTVNNASNDNNSDSSSSE